MKFNRNWLDLNNAYKWDWCKAVKATCHHGLAILAFKYAHPHTLTQENSQT